jgi:D-alanyl-D-alanine carboxypeptidase
MKALAGGKVLNDEYQRIWADSPQLIDPANPYNWYGYGIDQLRWGPNTFDVHGGQTAGYNSEAGYDPVNDLTVVIWTNLTLSLDNRYTAELLMLKVLDQVYATSPLAPPPSTEIAP